MTAMTINLSRDEAYDIIASLKSTIYQDKIAIEDIELILKRDNQEYLRRERAVYGAKISIFENLINKIESGVSKE